MKKFKHKINCQCPWCKAKRGEYEDKNNPMFGKKHSKKTRSLQSKNRKNKGKKSKSKEHKRKISLALQNKEKTKEHIQKVLKTNPPNIPMQLTQRQNSIFQETIPNGTLSISEISGSSSKQNDQNGPVLFIISRPSS